MNRVWSVFISRSNTFGKGLDQDDLIILLSLFSLFLGICIYLFIRVTPTYIEAMLFEHFGFDTGLLVIRTDKFGFFSKVLNIYGADFFWMLSFSLGVKVAFCDLDIFQGLCRVVMIFVSFLVGFVLELLQLFSIINGAFDLIDMIVFVFAIITSIFVLNFFEKRSEGC